MNANNNKTLSLFDTLNKLDDCYQQGLHLALQQDKGCYAEIQAQAKLLEKASAYVMYGSKDYAHGTLRAMTYRLKDSQLLNNSAVSWPLRIANVFLQSAMIKLSY